MGLGFGKEDVYVMRFLVRNLWLGSLYVLGDNLLLILLKGYYIKLFFEYIYIVEFYFLVFVREVFILYGGLREGVVRYSISRCVFGGVVSVCVIYFFYLRFVGSYRRGDVFKSSRRIEIK